MSPNRLLPIFHIQWRELHPFFSIPQIKKDDSFLSWSHIWFFYKSFWFCLQILSRIFSSLTTTTSSSLILSNIVLPMECWNTFYLLSCFLSLAPYSYSQFRCQNDLFKHAGSYNFSVQNIPMTSFRLIWNKKSGSWCVPPVLKFLCLAPSFLNHSLLATLWAHSSDRPACLCLRASALDVFAACTSFPTGCKTSSLVMFRFSPKTIFSS